MTTEWKWRHLNFASMIVLGVLSLQSFFYSIMLSMLPPFFPVKAKSLGLSDFEIGSVFSIFSGFILVSSLFFGQKARVIGRKRLIIAGIVLECISLAVFGLSSRVWQFLVLRAIQGIGAGASNTATFALLADHFADNLGFTNGIVQTIIGVGFLVGPPLGSWLFEMGGFFLPFVGTAGVAFPILLIAAFFLPKDHSLLINVNVNNGAINSPRTEGERVSTYSVYSALKRANIFVTGMTVALMSLTFSNIDSTLTLFLQNELHLNPIYYALGFFMISLLYAIASFLVGYITDRLRRHKLVMLVGIVVISLSVFSLGKQFPADFLGVLIDVSVLGVGGAMALIPSCPDMLVCAIKDAKSDVDSSQDKDIDVVSPIAGLHSSLYAVGQIIGPLIGTGLDVLMHSFSAMYLVVGGVLGAFGVLVLFPYTIYEWRNNAVDRNRNTFDDDESDNMRNPLLL